MKMEASNLIPKSQFYDITKQKANSVPLLTYSSHIINDAKIFSLEMQSKEKDG